MDSRDENDPVMWRIRDVLEGLPSLRIAYLYGSFLSRTDFRDIDIALIVKRDLPDDMRLALASRAGDLLEEAFGYVYRFDIRILNDEPVWFRYEVIRSGIPLVVRSSEDRIDFETGVLIEYQDLKFMYDLFDTGYLVKA